LVFTAAVGMIKNAAAAKVMTSDIALQVGGKLTHVFKKPEMMTSKGMVEISRSMQLYSSAASSILMFKIFPVTQAFFGIDHLFANVIGPIINFLGDFLAASSNQIIKEFGERLKKVDLSSMLNKHSDGKQVQKGLAGWWELVSDRIHSEFGTKSAWSGPRMLHDALLGQIMHVFGITYSTSLAGNLSKTQGFFSGIGRSLSGVFRKFSVIDGLGRSTAANFEKSLLRRFVEKAAHQVDNMIMFNLLWPAQAAATIIAQRGRTWNYG
jgi:hypothetical protein